MVKTDQATRRNFLKGATAAAIAAMVRPAVAQPIPADKLDAVPPMSFKDRLRGPVYSNPCPFKADLSLDDDAQKKAIKRALRAGIGVFATTAGNSQYATLSFDEVKQLNRVMIEAVASGALTIAATGDWTTEQAIEFAHFVQDLRADALQVMLPKALAENEDGVVKHFESIASSTKLPIVLHGKYSDALLAKLVKIDSVQAMKEDSLLEDYVRQLIDHGNRINIFGGGGENRYYVGFPYGAKAYYSTYSTFAPDIAASVYKVIQTGDIKAAAAMTAKYDYPFIRRFSHGMWHATLELFHIGTRHVRAPQKVLTDEQVADLKKFFEAQGVSPDRYAD